MWNDRRRRRVFGRQRLALEDLFYALRDRVECPAHIRGDRVTILFIRGYLEIRPMSVRAAAAADHSVPNKSFGRFAILSVDHGLAESMNIAGRSKDRAGTDQKPIILERHVDHSF